MNIIKPINDTREYKGGMLKNGIKYIIYNDDKLVKSFVSVSIHTGTFHSPKGYDGLPHFLEHMLFMGSVKYPDTTYYFNKINENGGYSNAYTDNSETVYYFNIYNNALNEIMEIFSRFFIDPLFDIKCVNKEINAVNNEHLMHINDDMWIKQQFILDLTKEKSPFNIFGTGSLETLNKPDILDVLKAFHKKYYVANNMSICIGSSLPFEEIELILNTYFSEIPKNETNSLEILNYKDIFQKPNSAYYLKSYGDIYEVSYVWEIDKYTKTKYSKDFQILKFIINNNSKDGLKFILTNKGYLVDIYIDIYKEGILLFNLFLTKYGMDNLNIVEGILFNYLQIIIYYDKYNIYAQYAQQIFNDNFNFINKLDSVTLCNLLSTNQKYYDIKDAYHGDSKIFEIKDSKDYIKSYQQINNNFIKIIHKENYDIRTDYKLTKMYGAKFIEIDKSNILIDTSIKFDINKIFDINNDFLNIDSKLINNLDENPIQIRVNEWYCGNSKFNEPYIYINYMFYNKKLFNNIRNYILTKISCEILNFIIDTILYKPLELSYVIMINTNIKTSTINITIKSLNDINKLNLLLNDVYLIINDTNNIKLINDIYIKNLINSYKESLNNIKFMNPWEYTNIIFNNLTNENDYYYLDLLKELNKVSVNDIKQFYVNLFNDVKLTKFIYGNIDKKDIINLNNSFDKYYSTDISELSNNKQILNNYVIEHPNPKESSIAVNYYYLIDNTNIKQIKQNKNILLSLLTINIISQKFFDILRTKFQLGYLVKMRLVKFKNHYYITQCIQSDKKPNYVKLLIKHFNNYLIEIIETCDFNKYINTLKNQLDEKSTSLLEEYEKHLSEIILQEYVFNRDEILLDELNTITKQDLINFIKKYITKENRKQIIICKQS